MKHHQKITIEQFTKQAIPFTQLSGHSSAIDLLADCARLTATDTVLDVACGPGLVSCALAKKARHVTGIDITPKMIATAEENQHKELLSNLSWVCEDVENLPFPDGSFSVVISRYSFHHFLSSMRVLREMVRVCQPYGRIVVADVVLPVEKVKAYDALERLRDPSHVHALSLDEWENLLMETGLPCALKAHYEVEMELETQLNASFPNAGDADIIRQMLWNDVGVNALGVNASIAEGQLIFRYPIGVFVIDR